MDKFVLLQAPIGRARGALPDACLRAIFTGPHRVPGSLHRGTGGLCERPPVFEVCYLVSCLNKWGRNQWSTFSVCAEPDAAALKGDNGCPRYPRATMVTN